VGKNILVQDTVNYKMASSHFYYIIHGHLTVGVLDDNANFKLKSVVVILEIVANEINKVIRREQS
jgi:hypothetical protein